MANVLSQAKDLFKLQQEARNMQNKMKNLVVAGTVKDESVEVRINGLHELVDIDIASDMLAENKKSILVRNIKEAFKDAEKKLQKELMKDMDLEKMKSLLGA